MAAPMPVSQERLIANRDLRVSVGEKAEVVEVKLGEDWPAEALGRLDVLVRNGYVIRWDENGKLDPRSWPYARRLGIAREQSAPIRGFLARARALEQTTKINGRRIRVFAGRSDRAESELFVVGGKAFPVLRGAPDSLAAREALRASIGGDETVPRRRGRSNGKRRRRRQAKA